ncbi:hypothetical protein E1B03_14780 [Citrobacter arsenatis]|uniref:Uncharacterized protein n=1 Tax=Citrobacter arsenatis TaxID=2546350 RepID=A0A4P6WJX7_9ENTR|nr:hypothetical protein E1B03_14780 [Citrobacter arsenatis]
MFVLPHYYGWFFNQTVNPVRIPVRHRRLSAVRSFFVLLLAITDFIYSGDSNDHLASIIYVPPLPETRYYSVERNELQTILINVKSSAKYLAGKYQMRFLTANTFYKFVNQFSFIENKSH